MVVHFEHSLERYLKLTRLEPIDSIETKKRKYKSSYSPTQAAQAPRLGRKEVPDGHLLPLDYCGIISVVLASFKKKKKKSK